MSSSSTHSQGKTYLAMPVSPPWPGEVIPKTINQESKKPIVIKPKKIIDKSKNHKSIPPKEINLTIYQAAINGLVNYQQLKEERPRQVKITPPPKIENDSSIVYLCRRCKTETIQSSRTWFYCHRCDKHMPIEETQKT